MVVGVKTEDLKSDIEIKTLENNNYLIIPDSFNSINNWENCTSIGEIRDQANCASCWAVSFASVASDRWCIAKN